MPQYDRKPGDTALCFASWARTALDDPEAIAREDLPDSYHGHQGHVTRHARYAIDRLDDLFDLLDPAEETRENFARALTELGLIIESHRETMETFIEGGEAEYAKPSELLTQSLDLLDEAINALRDDGEPTDVEIYGAGV